MHTERKKAVQPKLSWRLWTKVKPPLVLAFAILLGVLVGRLVGGRIGFTAGLVIAATAMVLMAGVAIWIEAIYTRNTKVIHELNRVHWLKITGRFWLVATILLGIPIIIDILVFSTLDGATVTMLRALEAIAVCLFAYQYREQIASWIVKKETPDDQE